MITELEHTQNKTKKIEMEIRITPLVIAIALVVLLAQSSFAQGLEGRWRGGWQSCTNGHKGRMSAQFRRIDSTQVQAKFKGTFFKVIPFRYRPVLDIVYEEPGLIVLQGNKRLPLGGNFEYNATISGNQFSATYRSKRDNGVWQLQR